MKEFTEYIYQKFSNEMRSWKMSTTHDIYVIALYIRFNDEDVRQFEVSLNYNTVQNWRNQIPKTSDPDEAKWNYAFWLEPHRFNVCESPKYNPRYPDEEGIKLRDGYLRSLNLPYYLTDQEQETLLDDPDRSKYDNYSSTLNQIFVDVCVEVTQRLHNAGDVVAACDKPVPVVLEILNDMDSSHAREGTIRANPEGLANEYDRLAPI